ncbi:hypothetical protein O181_095314 [Austropuccinia psidii MF-1]|uniref:Uncharacterized protein n=1 Tax=Austropuccinia psidii MF-1 TaxID=1389203 RepID=A0A9Q3J4V3_9BASI|nr:hypothetical protein [Austropuccinia psidii MF-1]
MNPQNHFYGRGFWDWASKPHSTPASPPYLATLSRVPSPFPSSKDIPEAALAFYAFIEGEYNPCLFVADPLSYFLGEEAMNVSSRKNKNSFRKPCHSYGLPPRDFCGRVIKPSRQH